MAPVMQPVRLSLNSVWFHVRLPVGVVTSGIPLERARTFFVFIPVEAIIGDTKTFFESNTRPIFIEDSSPYSFVGENDRHTCIHQIYI